MYLAINFNNWEETNSSTKQMTTEDQMTLAAVELNQQSHIFMGQQSHFHVQTLWAIGLT